MAGSIHASRSSAGASLVIGATLTLAVVAVALMAPVIAPVEFFAGISPPLAPPSAAHLMGTDDLGRDVLAGVVQGARTSLLVVIGVTLLASAIGLAVGLVAGYEGGIVDDTFMRATEFVQVIPRFFLAVAVIALFGAGVDRLVVLLGLTSWPWLARVVRAETLSVKARGFVDAARALGASDARIITREILPSALGPAVVVIALNASGVILLEAALSFLGLGDPRRVSWGYLANNAQPFLRVAWWMAVFPGAAILLAVLGLNLLGDAVDDRLAGRSRRARPITPPAAADDRRALESPRHWARQVDAR